MKSKQVFLTLMILTLVPFYEAYAAVNSGSLEEKTTSNSAFSGARVSIMAGLNSGNVNTTFNDSNIKISSGNRTGLAGGIAMEIGVTEQFAVGPELLYVQKGGTWTSGTHKVSTNYDALEIPLLAKAKFGSELIKAVAFGGPSASFAVNRSEEIDGEKASTENIKGFDVSLHLGAGAEYALSSTTSLFINGRYMAGLLNQSKVEGSSSKLSGFLFLTGVSLAM